MRAMITVREKMHNAFVHLEMLRDEIREIQNEHPESFIYSDRMFQLNNVRRNLAAASDLMKEMEQAEQSA